MSLADLSSRAAVLSAIAEYRDRGRKAFLSRYGFGQSIRYFLSYDGELFDSKAIVGAAHGYQFPALGPLQLSDLSGGDRTVRTKLEELGFSVVVLPPSRPHQVETTRVGYVSPNNQRVLRDTGLPGTDHNQRIYVLRCGDCGSEYGANGSDIFQRRCPSCQAGKPGLLY
jgi:hypothetical protein